MPIVVDTGAIFAFLDRRDRWHGESSALFSSLPKPFYTCEAVLTEICYLLHSERISSQRVFGLIEVKTIVLKFDLASESQTIGQLMEKYKTMPMSLADACLVRMSEVFDAPVFTFDGDFRIYRRNRRSVIPLIGID